MASPLLVLFTDFVRRLRAWQRRLVLRSTGEPVELLELHETAGERRCMVVLASGRRTMVAEADLESELAMRGVALAVCGALALGGVLAGGSLGLTVGERLFADVAVCAQAARQLGGRTSVF